MSARLFSTDFNGFTSQMMPHRNKKDPEWLTSLQGNSPLLEQPELDYIAEVRRCIIQREQKCVPNSPCDQHLKNKLSLMKDNFEKVVRYLKENSRSKEYFLRTYPAWRPVRNRTIFQLKEIAKSVNEDSQNCSVSRGVGSTISFIGGLMCLAAGNGASRVAGSVLMGLGSLTSAGTSSVEVSLLRKKIKEAENIIEEDREHAVKLWNWISDVSHIEEALSIIRNIDVDLNLKKAANEFHGYCKMKISKGELTKNIVEIVKFLKVSSYMVDDIADVVGIFLSTSMLYDRYGALFNYVFQAYKCEKMLSTACNVLFATLKVTSAVNASKGSELTTFQKSKIVSGMALDAISIFLATEGMNSTSKEAKEIIKAAEKLKEEADIFKKLYITVCNQ